MSADIAFIDANIRTMNPCQPLAQAVAIKKNRILKVGTSQEIKKLIGKSTKVIKRNGLLGIAGPGLQNKCGRCGCQKAARASMHY